MPSVSVEFSIGARGRISCSCFLKVQKEERWDVSVAFRLLASGDAAHVGINPGLINLQVLSICYE